MNRKWRVGILGATGMVGQRFVVLLQGHPWFEVGALAASDRSAGRPYGEAVQWLLESPLPEEVAALPVQKAEPGLECDFVFSGLSADAAREVEPAFAAAGYPVISNASAFRNDPLVPLLVPEVNGEHVHLIRKQQKQKGFSRGGFLVTNPNCSTTGLVLSLAPLFRRFGLEKLLVTTLQALSGAGFPGVPSLQILANVLPQISGEAEKIEWEPRKIFGVLGEGQIRPAELVISAQCNRVPVRDGHLISVSVQLEEPASLEEVRQAFREYRSPLAKWNLPSAPAQPVCLTEDPLSPQPLLHAGTGGGMAVTVGQLRECPVLDFRFVALVHNTVRGAAGGAILNAEWLAVQGYLG